MSFFSAKKRWKPIYFLSERLCLKWWMFVVFILTFSIDSFGNTITVTNTNSSGAGSLDQAIQDFISGGTSSTIEFDAGLIGSTITITQAYSFSANSLIIDGDVNGDGSGDITLQSDGTDHRFFSLSGTAAVTFKNLQIENFSSTGDGGVIQISTGTVTIENCLVRNNTGRSGGVINIENGFGTGDANISKSIFSGNSATSFGGVISQASFLSSVHTVIENSLFFNNSAPNSNGGVAYISDGANFTLRHVTLANNSSKFSGGAILNNNNLTIENSLIVGNSSESGPSNILNNRTYNNVGGSIVGGENGASDEVTDYFTDAANGDYNLFSTSPAVNAGLNSLTAAAGITSDIVGNAQPNVGITSVVDAGAYEFLGDPPISFESSSVINSSMLTITLTFDRQISGLDNADFTTASNALSLSSLTSPDDVEYTATFTLSDLTQRVVDTVFMDALVEDMFMNNLQARDTAAFIYYVPVAQVTNTLTTGEGSFDQALQDFIASEGTVNRVEFDPSLVGSTIMMTQGYTFSQGTLTVDGDIDDDGAIDVTLKSDGTNHRLFDVAGSSSLTLERLRLRDFATSNLWGGVVLVNSGAAMVNVQGCEMLNNHSGRNGGAIYGEAGNVTIGQSIFDGNSGDWGGAVTIFGGTTTIENSVFSSNSASLGGAVYGRNGASIFVRHCTFSGNEGTANGGAIYNLNQLTVENSLFVSNAVNSTVNNIRNEATFNDNGGNIYGGEIGAPNEVADYFTDAVNDDYTLHLRSLAADQGDNSLATNAGITEDLSGNPRPFAGLVQIVDVGAYELQADPDFVAPAVSLSTSAANLTNDNPIPVTITFSESVSGFESGDITVSGGVLDNFTGSSASYSFDLIPDGDGSLTVDVAASAATDAAGNSNTAATQLSIDYDGTAPTVSLSTTSSDPTNENPIPVTATFSESVTDFESDDITISGGTIDNFTGSGTSYSFDLLPSTTGTLTIDIVAEVALDAAGNGNASATQLSIDYDGTTPTVIISTTSLDPTNDNPVPVTVTFSESVTGFESGDLTISGGTIDNFTGSSASYSFDLIPNGDGSLTVDVAASVATDVTGNENTAATQLSIDYDATAPTVSLSTTSSDPTNDNPIPVTVTFSESVNGFESGDITVSGGTIDTFTGSSTSYSFDLLPDGDGSLTVDVAASVATDAAGNSNTAATQLSIDYDATAPTVTLSTTSSDPTNDNPIPVTVTFSESVNGFESGDITVSGGTIDNFTGSSTSYSFDLIPDGDGTLTVDVTASVATDAAGNSNTAASQLSIDFDATAPTVSLSTTSSDPTNDNPIPVTVTFSESVTGFESGDITVIGGTIDDFAGSSTSYSFDLIPDGDGSLTVDVAASVATDVASNENAAATQLSIDYDGTTPTVSLSTTSSDSTNDNPIPVTVTFSESVKGFESGDLTISGGTIDNFTGSSASYSFDLIPNGDGSLAVDVAASVVTDVTGNENTAATQLSIDYDATAPTVSLSTTSSDPTNANPIPITVTFSESVTGFESGDLNVSGGAIDNFSGSSTSYSFDLIPDGGGILTVDVAASVATDAAGNNNSATSQLSIDYDATAPTVSLFTTSLDPTNDNPIPVTVTFSESVTGFESGDITVSGGAIDNFTGSSSSYSFDLIPDGDGTLTVDVVASVATDVAGNSNTAATQLSLDYDATAPTVSLFTTSLDPTNDNPIPVEVTFSESVTGFESGDISVIGGTIDNFTGSSASYSFDLIPDGDGSLTVDVAASVASDAAGNENTAASQLSIDYDGTAPSVTVDELMTEEVSPQLTGTVDDPEARVVVMISDQSVPALNNGNGTWVLEDNTLTNLEFGTYDVIVLATDLANNVGTDNTIDELVIQAQTVLSVNKQNLTLELYPNPTTDRLFISGGLTSKEVNSIQIFDGRGIVSEVQFSDGYWDVSDLDTGTYFLRMVRNGHVIIKRFLKH